MASPVRQIFAFSGVLESGPGEKESFALVEHAMAAIAGKMDLQALGQTMFDRKQELMQELAEA